jgi:HEPN domain-containing protein
MSRKPTTPGSPEEWLARAKGNLANARQPKPPDAFWEDHCYMAQQAVEKALKAVYQHRGLLFQFIHDIGELGKGLEQGGLRIPPEIRGAFVLTKYASETRYPGPFEPVTETEFKKAFALAEGVVAWADKIIGTTDKLGGPLAQETPAIYRAGKARKPKARPRKRK